VTLTRVAPNDSSQRREVSHARAYRAAQLTPTDARDNVPQYVRQMCRATLLGIVYDERTFKSRYDSDLVRRSVSCFFPSTECDDSLFAERAGNRSRLDRIYESFLRILLHVEGSFNIRIEMKEKTVSLILCTL